MERNRELQSMNLVSTKQILNEAKRKKYAIGAFNVENMEMLKACIESAQYCNSPIIIQVSEKSIEYIGIGLLYSMVNACAFSSTIPIALHLDHAQNMNLIREACEIGFSSVMIDSSEKGFSSNVQDTLKVMEIAKRYNVSVEAELGHVGGKAEEVESMYTPVSRVKKFVAVTQVDFLAVAIGTKHGIYKGSPQLDFQRLKNICESVDIPLVLHGASGLSDSDIKQCVVGGISKINFATELRRKYTNSIKQVLEEKNELIDPRIYGKVAQKAMSETVIHYINICGSGVEDEC